MLILRIRKARLKARTLAIAEAIAVLQDLGATVAPGGPMSDQPGIFWIDLPDQQVEAAAALVPLLGYTEEVIWLEPTRGNARFDVRWRGKNHRYETIYEEDSDETRELAPDRRVFLLPYASGELRPVRGYRGDGQPSSRRGLSVFDARLLVNLAGGGKDVLLLDPFAGVGGITLEAQTSGCRILSVDNDPVVQFGLNRLGSLHIVGDASALPYPSNSVEAIATEPPYDEDTLPVVIESLAEMTRVLQRGGNIAMLYSLAHAEDLRRHAASLPLTPVMDEIVDRKKLLCVLFVWRKK